MSDLRDKLIKLAHENPELRKHLLPLVKEASSSLSSLRRDREDLEGYLDEMEALVSIWTHRGSSGDYEADASLADTYGDVQKAVTLIRKASGPLAQAIKLLKRVK